MHSKLIGETSPIIFVIISLNIPRKIWVMMFTSHIIHNVHIHHPNFISGILFTWKDYLFLLQCLELLDESRLCLRMVFRVLFRSASVKYRFRNPREYKNNFSSLGILLEFFLFSTLILVAATPVVCRYPHICDATTCLTTKRYLKPWCLVVDDNGSIFSLY